MKIILTFFDKDTKEFLAEKEIDTAMMGDNLPNTIKTRCTLKVKENQARVLNENNRWIYKEDNRGKTSFKKETKEEKKVDYIGEIKAEYTLLIPKPTDKWEVDKWVANIEVLKQQKKYLIKTKFEEEANSPIATDGVSYHGGEESSIKLNNAFLLEQRKGNSTVTFFDTNNMPIELPLLKAANIIIQIAERYQLDFSKYESLKVQLANAKTEEEINQINWEA